MSRPKKLEVPQKNTLEEKIAEYISEFCDTPGCSPKFHLHQAKKIIEIVKEAN